MHKKSFAIFLILFSIPAFIFSLDLGIRGGLNFGVGTTLSENLLVFCNDDNNFLQAPNKANFGCGTSIYGKLNVYKFRSIDIGIQIEMNFNFNNGLKSDINDIDDELSNNTIIWSDTLDFPVLCTFTVPVLNEFEIGGALGVQISIPFHLFAGGYLYLYNEKIGGEVFPFFNTSIQFGFVFCLTGNYAINENIRLVADVRYNLDVNPAKGLDDFFFDELVGVLDIFTRRGLGIGIGVQYSF
ncbi:MAG: hypothetical protein J5747_02515 [Spirochaetaceae bacterium]|nr:hypothetical protein [Spirochaetaceae bacterium]